MDLPAEIWAQIFNLAADDDLIFQYGLQTSFSVHAWWKAFHGDWLLRSPMEASQLHPKTQLFHQKGQSFASRVFEVILTQQDDLVAVHCVYLSQMEGYWFRESVPLPLF